MWSLVLADAWNIYGHTRNTLLKNEASVCDLTT